MKPNKEAVTKESLKRLLGSLGETLKALVLPIVCVLVSVSLFLAVVIPGIADIKGSREIKEEKEVDLSRYQDKSRRLLSLAAQAALLDEAYTLVGTALPDKDDIPQLMTELQLVGDEAGVALSSLQYSGRASKEAKDIAEVGLQMGVEGEFSQVEELLRVLEGASRVVTVERFNIGTRKEASMSATLALSSFFMPAEKEQKFDTPVTLDLNAPKFQEDLGRVRKLKIYEVTVEEGIVGKENPFGE